MVKFEFSTKLKLLAFSVFSSCISSTQTTAFCVLGIKPISGRRVTPLSTYTVTQILFHSFGSV